MRGSGLEPRPELQPTAYSKRSRTSWSASEACRPPAESLVARPMRRPRRLSSTSVVRAPSISAECLAPPEQKMRSMPATSSARGRDLRMRGERLGDVAEVARRQGRARRDAIGGGVVAAEPQQLVGNGPVAAGGIERRLAVDRHPRAPVVDDRAVLVEQDAADRHVPPPPSAVSGGAHCALLGARMDRQIADAGRLRPRADWPGPRRS